MNEQENKSNDFMITTSDNPYSPKKEFEKWHLFDVTKGYSTLENIERIKNILKEHYAERGIKKYSDDDLEIMAKEKIMLLGPVTNYKKIYFNDDGDVIVPKNMNLIN